MGVNTGKLSLGKVILTFFVNTLYVDVLFFRPLRHLNNGLRGVGIYTTGL